MIATNLFAIANVNQLRTYVVLEFYCLFFRTSWCVRIINSAIFLNSFHKRVEFGTIFWRAFGISGGGFDHPKPPLGTPLLGSYKYTFLDFCVTHIWELMLQIFESTTGFIHTFHKVFHEPQLYVQRGLINFLRKNKKSTDDMFLPWRQWCSFRPHFIYLVILLVPAVPLTLVTAVFCVPELHS